MPRLLIRQLVEHAVAVLDVLGGRDRVQVVDHDAVLEPLPAALDDDGHLAADGGVEHGRERHELGDQLAVDLDEHVAGLELARRRRLRNHLLDDEQARLLRIRLAHARFGVAREPQAAQLGERLVDELRLQRAARHGLAALGFVRSATSTRSSGRKKLDAACEFAPAFSATTRPSMSTTGEPDEPPDVPDAACR